MVKDIKWHETKDKLRKLEEANALSKFFTFDKYYSEIKIHYLLNKHALGTQQNLVSRE